MNTKTERITNTLGTEPVGKLIKKYATPCVISLVVNGLYNIVDQIFIGHGVGYLGNSATNVVFPLTIFSAALGVLLGDAAATYMSLKLGEGKPQKANRGGCWWNYNVHCSIGCPINNLRYTPQTYHLSFWMY